MRGLNWLWRRVRGVLRSDEIGREIAEEMQFHVDMRTEANVRAGMPKDEARREAERRFGNRTEVGERGYEVRGGAWVETVVQDARYAFRTLLARPGFAVAAVASLALGIGASTAIFSVVDGVLLRPLPYPDADRIVAFREVSERGTRMRVAEPNFLDARANVQTLEALAAYADGEVSVAGGSEPVRARVCEASADFFRVMGVAPAVGRGFLADESAPGGPPAAVVSDGFWRRQLGGRSDLSAVSLRLPGRTLAVVGVMPPGFGFPEKTDVWTPSEADGPPSPSRTAHNWSVVGRVRSGVSLDAASAEASALARRLRAEHGTSTDAVDFALVPLQEFIVGTSRPALLVLLGAVGLLLVVACANVANMLLARATSRSHEFAVRAALGATRGRLARQSVTESLLLVGAACALGVALAHAGLGALAALAGPYLPRTAEVSLNAVALGFACGVSLVVGVGLGLLPAARGPAARAASGLGAAGRVAGDASSRRLGGALVVAQVALALVLAVGAGLLARSFVTLVRVDPGFRAESAITMTLSPPESPEGAARGAEVARFERPLLERIGQIPGVSAVGSTSSLPLAGGGSNGTFRLEADRSRAGDAEFRCVTDGYFAAMGIPLLTGRGFESGDGPDAPHVAVVSRTFAERYFPNEDPVGRRILFGNMDGDDRPLEVVGIAGDVRERGLDREVRPVVYANALQRPRSWVQTYVVRTEGDPNAAAAAMRAALRDLQPDGAATFETLERVVASSVDDRRFALVVVAAFAVVALALAAAGVYGVMSYTVAQRTREIGIQMALGARRGQVLGLVLGRGIRLAGTGVLVGLAGSLAATRALSGLLFGVTATDPLTLVGVAALLVATAIAACLGPARRATRVDPLVALKAE